MSGWSTSLTPTYAATVTITLLHSPSIGPTLDTFFAAALLGTLVHLFKRGIHRNLVSAYATEKLVGDPGQACAAHFEQAHLENVCMHNSFPT